jgi:hypothetical protein
MILGTIAIVLGTIAIGLLLTRKTPIMPNPEELAQPPKKRPAHGAGEAPATAIRAGAAQLARLKTSQRCGECRTVMVAGDEEHVHFGGGELLVVQLRCEKCGTRRALYVSEARPTTA